MFSTMWVYFFFNDTATTEIYTLSLHDALPISWNAGRVCDHLRLGEPHLHHFSRGPPQEKWRSEEHTSELQSHSDLVCRLLLEKKNKRFLISIVYTHRQSYYICN